MGAPRLPNFLVIGAMKSGTTALYYYLRQHREIYLNPGRKEAQFFSYEGQRPRFSGPGDADVNDYVIDDVEEYRRMFEDALGQPAVGEVGTVYVYVPGSAERIRHHVPDAKLIAILRDPARRAHSSFVHLLREGLEPCRTLASALEREPQRIRENWSPHWHYLQAGLYHGQIRRYLELFDRDQLRIYLYDDYQSNPKALVQDMFRFLGVDDRFVPDMSQRYNVGGIPWSRRLHAFLDRPHAIKRVARSVVPGSGRRLALRERIRALNMRPPPPLEPAMRRRLVDFYREDVLALQDLIGRDLSRWLA